MNRSTRYVSENIITWNISNWFIYEEVPKFKQRHDVQSGFTFDTFRLESLYESFQFIKAKSKCIEKGLHQIEIYFIGPNQESLKNYLYMCSYLACKNILLDSKRQLFFLGVNRWTGRNEIFVAASFTFTWKKVFAFTWKKFQVFGIFSVNDIFNHINKSQTDCDKSFNFIFGFLYKAVRTNFLSSVNYNFEEAD